MKSKLVHRLAIPGMSTCLPWRREGVVRGELLMIRILSRNKDKSIVISSDCTRLVRKSISTSHDFVEISHCKWECTTRHLHQCMAI